MVRAALDVGYRFGAGATGTTRAASRQTGKKQIPAAQRVASQISRPAKTPCPSHNFAFARDGSYVSAIPPKGLDLFWIQHPRAALAFALLALGFLSPFRGFSLFHSFMNSFQSATPWALRMSADTGSSFGASGALKSFKPASCGRRLPLRVFTSLLDQTRFSQASLPPR